MSKIPKVFVISKTMNQRLCDSREAFHNARPFQGIDQSITIAMSQTGRLSNIAPFMWLS